MRKIRSPNITALQLACIRVVFIFVWPSRCCRQMLAHICRLRKHGCANMLQMKLSLVRLHQRLKSERSMLFQNLRTINSSGISSRSTGSSHVKGGSVRNMWYKSFSMSDWPQKLENMTGLLDFKGPPPRLVVAVNSIEPTNLHLASCCSPILTPL